MDNKPVGIIIAGGKGTRFRHSTIKSKHLYKIGGKAIINRNIDLISKFTNKIIVVTNSKFSRLFKQAIHSANVKYKIDNKILGIAHALSCSLGRVSENTPIITILGDYYIENNIIKEKLIMNTIDKINSGEKIGLLLLQEVKDPSRFAVAKYNKSGSIIKIIEKPKSPPSSMAVHGFYVLPAESILEAFSMQTVSKRGEYEIGTLLNIMLKSGVKFQAQEISKSTKVFNIDTVELAKKVDLLIKSKRQHKQYRNIT